MKELKNKLAGLKLSGMVKTIENRNNYAIESKISYIEFIEMLLQDEYLNRKGNSFDKRYIKSKLSKDKLITTYDFLYQPDLDKKIIMELGSCRFIKEKKNIVFMGNPGVGKTHLANAIGIEALKQGHKVLMMHSSEMVEKLYLARGDGTYNSILKNLVELDLLIIDEVGFKKIGTNCVDEFFEIIRRRYENGSIIITTNRNFEEWGNIFGDAVLASAIIDRIIHHSYVIRITGNSFRIKNLTNN